MARLWPKETNWSVKPIGTALGDTGVWHKMNWKFLLMQVLISMSSVSMVAMWSQNERNVAACCPPIFWTYLKHSLTLHYNTLLFLWTTCTKRLWRGLRAGLENVVVHTQVFHSNHFLEYFERDGINNCFWKSIHLANKAILQFQMLSHYNLFQLHQV